MEEKKGVSATFIVVMILCMIVGAIPGYYLGSKYAEKEDAKVINKEEKKEEDIDTSKETDEETPVDEETEEKDYSGTFENEDSSTISFVKDNGSYKVNISLYRLTDIDGEVTKVEDDILYITATDANEEPVEFTFNYNDKTLKVEKTTWDNFQVGDTFTFDKE